MKNRNFLHDLGDWVAGNKKSEPIQPPVTEENRSAPQKSVGPPAVSGARVSEPSWGFELLLSGLSKELNVVSHDFMLQIIPLIRKLIQTNPNVSQALNNIVTLGNTGHKVFFDPRVSPEQVDAMRIHLQNSQRQWAPGQPNMDGVVNKMMSQIMIGGALSNEWVPRDDLSGIETIVLVNPEEIRFALDKTKKKYSPYQLPKFVSSMGFERLTKTNLIPLNENTYKYFSLNGDTEVPYGFPPYMSIMNSVVTQTHMLANINFMIDMAGLLGFIEFLMEKPDKISGEDDKMYQDRLTGLLVQAKHNIQSGMKDGVVAGYAGDHTFKFNSVSGRDVTGVMELYKANEMQMFSGLFTDPTIAGRDYNTSETQITVIFMKMVSQLKNIQNLVKSNLEFGYALDLRLAGFKFDYLSVRFRKSTLQDEYKSQQAEEIKIKNAERKYILGLTSQEQMADELDYEAPAEKEPRVPLEVLLGTKQPDATGAAGQPRQDQKNKSAKKTRSNNKPAGAKK